MGGQRSSARAFLRARFFQVMIGVTPSGEANTVDKRIVVLHSLGWSARLDHVSLKSQCLSFVIGS